MDELRKQLRSLPTMAESEADQFKLFNNTLEARLQVEIWTSFGSQKPANLTAWYLNDLSAYLSQGFRQQKVFGNLLFYMIRIPPFEWTT